MANFNIDQNGNMWIGTGVSNTFSTAQSDSNTKFYVESDGTIKAEEGSIGGVVIDANGMQSSNYDASTNTGWRIDNSQGTVFAYDIELILKSSNGSTEDDIPSDGKRKIQIGDIPIYDYNGNLNFHPASGKSIIIHNGNPFIIKGETGSAQMKFDGAGSYGDFIFDLDFVSWANAQLDNTRRYSNPTPAQEIREFYFENDNTVIFRANEQNADVEFFGDIGVPSGGKIYINGDDGTTGDVLKRTATGMEWGTLSSGISIQGGGVISVSESNNVYTISHSDADHSFLTQSAADTRYVNESDHTHSNLISDTTFNNHANSSTAHGTFDYYSYWTLRGNPGGNLQTANVGSTGTASIYAGTSMSASMSGSSITLNNTGVTSIGQSGSDGFVTAVSGSTVTTNPDLGTATIQTGTHLANVYGATLGSSTFGDKWYKLWAHNASDTSSDERLKENIVDIDYGLDFINDLRPVEFDWRSVTEYYCEEHPDEKYTKPRDFCSSCKRENDIIYMDYLKEKELFDNELIEEEPIEPTFTPCVMLESSKDMNEGKKTWGLIAQEVKTVLGDYQNHLVSHDTESDYYGLAYENLIAPLIKAVQELSTQISDLTARVELLEG